MIFAFEHRPLVPPQDDKVRNALLIVGVILQDHAARKYLAKFSYHLGLEFVLHRRPLDICHNEDRDANASAPIHGNGNYTSLTFSQKGQEMIFTAIILYSLLL
jgi:hypothetical protein